MTGLLLTVASLALARRIHTTYRREQSCPNHS
jgi:hypothetical protein